MSGYADTLPAIKSLHFKKNTLELHLVDGRIIIVPLKKFPAIKKLSRTQRRKYHIIAGIGFDFDDSDEVYHISDFLGEDNSLSSLQKKANRYHLPSSLPRVAEPSKKYSR